MQHSVGGDTLADILERVLDKGVVIAGDIKIKLVDVELLTIQVRLLIASVDKAKEMGIDWWVNNPAFSSGAQGEEERSEIARLKEQVGELESKLRSTAAGPPDVTAGSGPG